jgi:cytochrome c oxidase assembly protein subunit 15
MLGRLWRRRVSSRGFNRIAWISVGGLMMVVATGAIVRLTASGLGCDNWPRCGDKPFPEQGFHAFVEFGNRVVALVAIVITIVTWLASRRVDGLPRWVSWVAGIVAIGLIAQIPLGGLTVILELHPLAVMSHFFLALAMIGLSVVVALEAQAFVSGKPDSSVPRALGWVGLGLLPLGIALLVTGAFVTAAGPHSGGSDIRRLGNLEDALYVHVRLSAAFGIGFLVLFAGLVLHRRTARTELLLASGALVLLLVQMGIGEYQWRNQLPWGIVVVHVTLAAVIWGALVAIAVRLVWAAGLTRPAEARRGVTRAIPGRPAGQ